MTPTEIDDLYGLEPAIEDLPSSDSSPTAEFVAVNCPYCGEAFDTRADCSAGSCVYVEDCQICCQPIEMELRVDGDGALIELVGRRGDS
jgi:hypothetical protein